MNNRENNIKKILKGKKYPLSSSELKNLSDKTGYSQGDIEYVFQKMNKDLQYNVKYAKGGSLDENGIDLFEDYEKIPKKVQNILDRYEDAFVDGDYKELEKANKELNKIGYTFEYYLDGQAYDLRPIGTKGKSEMDEFRKGGSLDKENSDMVLNNNKQIAHHTKELASAVKGKKVPAWVVAKVNRSASDLSDATHYLDGSKYKKGGGIEKSRIYGQKDNSQKNKIDIYYKNLKGEHFYLSSTTSSKSVKDAVEKYKETLHSLTQTGGSLRKKLAELEGKKMAKGGYVFKGDKYQYVPTKFEYTIGGL